MASGEATADDHVYPPKVTVSGTDVRPKEAVLVILALLVLVMSLCLFFKVEISTNVANLTNDLRLYLRLESRTKFLYNWRKRVSRLLSSLCDSTAGIYNCKVI